MTSGLMSHAPSSGPSDKGRWDVAMDREGLTVAIHHVLRVCASKNVPGDLVPLALSTFRPSLRRPWF